MLPVLVALLLFPLAASATLYRWTDADGKVVYSDQPPPDHRKVDKTIRRAPPPDPAAARALAAEDAAQRERERGREEAARKAEKEEAEAKTRAERCAQVRANIKALESDSNVYRLDDKGQQLLLDAAARRHALEEATGQVKLFCGGT